MRILIVDDEGPARERLRGLIGDLQAGEVVGEARNGAEALELCRHLQPEVLLLDIRMPGMDGLEAAGHLAALDAPPAVIFTTAYEDYALAAFEAHAVDYLLKPIRRDRLQQALASATRLTRVQLQALARPDRGPRARTHISARVRGDIRLIPVRDIRYFLADHKYVTVRYPEGEVLIEESLKALEAEFGDCFVRVHRNALVAVAHLEGVERPVGGRWHVKLRDAEERLEVSRRHWPALRKRLGR